jgi:signal peptidase I
VNALYRFLLWSLVVLAGIYGVLRATAIRVWQVPAGDQNLGTSLSPTLAAGDWVVLWRLTPPTFGSLVVCTDPDDPRETVMGRIAARAGDLVSIDKGATSINGQLLPAAHICTRRKWSVLDPANERSVEVACDYETLGSVVHTRVQAVNPPNGRRFETQVGADRVFLLSDNRALPFDSRHFGTVLRASCNESVVFRLISAAGFFDVENRLTLVR